MKIARVKWLDSVSENGWQRGTDNQVAQIVSYGVVIADDAQAITLSTSVSGFGRCCDPLTIPKCAITALTIKEEPSDDLE